ncbi:diiron oxygenase [Luteimonas sp. Sa2BVA3]|uniref:Diiron oxygenase n=1 Tax=Luteimonas colneyensis TaxID=2762230 RepID=A0ABR8UFN1_9GAMM|nr:diiron oxygenase [Luteimonas colneyensis]MBD7986843.1 diiron oxygenase [Luteimonas colneyensis]
MEPRKAGDAAGMVDLAGLGFDAGAHLLVKHALNQVGVGEAVTVRGTAPGWQAQLSAWCRSQGHVMEAGAGVVRVRRGSAQAGRWRDAMPTGHSDPRAEDAIASRAHPRWGLAARGAVVEAGAPEIHFRLSDRDELWNGSAASLYRQAVAAQWDPEAIDWDDAPVLPDEIEDAVVQVMTFMVENENAALVIPARFLGQLHPHYRELQAALAIQIVDEARHIDVFTRRIRRHGREPALSTAGGQESLKSLLDETDYSVASFLLSVLGEGTFVSLLKFIQAEAPDPLTRQIARYAAVDEARHVALGMSHLLYRLQREPDFRNRLARAVEERHEALRHTGGLNEEVFDALVVMAAGALTPEAIAEGSRKVQALMKDMADSRYAKLVRLGFDPERAHHLSSLHTRNFM